jgi:hypothetical protein
MAKLSGVLKAFGSLPVRVEQTSDWEQSHKDSWHAAQILTNQLRTRNIA